MAAAVTTTLAMLLALLALPQPAEASNHEPFTMVNATASRWSFFIDGTPVDAAPEELVAAPGAFTVGGDNFAYGDIEFAIAPTGEGTYDQAVRTLTANVQYRANRDYSLVIHFDPSGQPQLSLWLDDKRPVPSGETRVEIRHVADGEAVTSTLRSNGENQSVPDDPRTDEIPHNTGIRYNSLVVNDYEAIGVPAGRTVPARGSTDPAVLGNLVYAYDDLELEGAASSVMYVTGQLVPAAQLDNTDVDHTLDYRRVTLDLADKGGAWKRDGYTDGFELRGFAGEATTTAVPTVTSGTTPTGQVDTRPFATTGRTGGGGDDGCANFSDVPSDGQFCTEIAWMADTGISEGYPDGTFRPTEDVTRRAMAAFLYRLAGEPAVSTDCSKFADMSTGDPFCDAIGWMAEEGISTGYPDNTFRPGDIVTRRAAAAYLYRLAGEPATSSDCSQFTDMSTGDPFCTAIGWMVEEGISTGYADGTFRPGATVTRQAAAAFLYRYDQL